MEERHLILFNVSGIDIESPIVDQSLKPDGIKWLKEEYNSRNTSFLVILIGKDGGVKIKDTKPLSSDRLFALIDGMPMRQQEMKNN